MECSEVRGRGVGQSGKGRCTWQGYSGKGIVGLRISPFGVVEKEKLQVIHDLTFSGGGATVQKTKGKREGEVTLKTEGRLANADTGWKKTPEYPLEGVMTDIITRILGEVWDTEADSAPNNGRQERVSAS